MDILSAAEEAEPPEIQSPPPVRRPPGPDVPLVGRGAELAQLAGAPLFLAATAREEQLADAPGLRSSIDEVAGDPSVLVVTLAPLSLGDTTRLVEAHGSPASRHPEVIERAWMLSEGNPFAAIEAVRASAEEPARAPFGRAQLPERVRRMIRRRLGSLGPLARGLAAAAAVIGRDFDFRLGPSRIAGPGNLPVRTRAGGAHPDRARHALAGRIAWRNRSSLTIHSLVLQWRVHIPSVGGLI